MNYLGSFLPPSLELWQPSLWDPVAGLPDCELFTSTSDLGFSCYFKGNWHWGTLPSMDYWDQQMSFGWWVLYMATLAFKLWDLGLSTKHILLIFDNPLVVLIMSQCFSLSKATMVLVCSFTMLAMQHNIKFLSTAHPWGQQWENQCSFPPLECPVLGTSSKCWQETLQHCRSQSLPRSAPKHSPCIFHWSSLLPGYLYQILPVLHVHVSATPGAFYHLPHWCLSPGVADHSWLPILHLWSP